MRFTTIAIIIFCLATFTVHGQKNKDQRTNNVLRGKILYLNSGKQPAIGVGIEGSISNIDYANKTYSANDGSYQLTFPNNKDGYKVDLEIDKTDGSSKEIEVVNSTEVEDCYIRAEVTNGFEIIVCPKGARDTVAQRYYNIIKTSSDFALEAKKKELDKLHQAQQKDWEEITAMTEKISQLEKQTDSLAIYRTAWRIASVNKDKANERVLKYIDSLDKGKTVQQALKILSIELASKQVDKGINIIDEAIEELELCAEASMTVFDYNSAIACYDTIIFKMEKMDKNPLSIATYYNLAWKASLVGGKFEKALKASKSSLSIREEILEPKHFDLAISYNNIAATNIYLGQYAKALEFQKKAIEIEEAILEPKHLDLAISYNNIAATYRFLGQYEKALEFQQKDIEISEATLEAIHPHLATSYNNIGVTYRFLGKYSKALKFHQKAIKINEATLEAIHPDFATSYGNIASAYALLEHYEMALEFQQKAIEILEEILDPKHPSLAASYNEIGVIYRSFGQNKKAFEFQKKAIEIKEEILDPKHPSLATSYINIASIHRSLGQYEKALEFGQKSITIFEEILDPKHPDLALSYNNIALTYQSLGRHEKALEFQNKAIDIISEALPKNHPYQQMFYNKKGLFHYYLKDYTKAIEAYQKAASLDSLIKSKDYYNNIGTAYVKNKQFKEAFEAFTEYEKLFPNEGRSFRNWAMYYALQNEKDKALTHLQKAIDLGFDDLEWLKTDDSMDSLRDEPAFIELLKQLEKSNTETQKNK